jgi:lipopolysaccharide biosynthesis glycosyltransferase
VINSPPMSIWLGYDSNETTAFAVARYSIHRFDRYIPVKGLVLEHLMRDGLYSRPTEYRVNSVGKRQLWDVISDAWMSTEFAISRFLVPTLAKSGWALFADSDVICRQNISRLFDYARNDKAVACVKHQHGVNPGALKKDAKMQLSYARKNWSSVMLFNCDHPANKRLTVEMVNTVPGRDLHRFCWLQDDEIGELPDEWNYLVRITNLKNGKQPALVHFTEGLPDLPGYEQEEYADEWRAMRPYAVGAL